MYIKLLEEYMTCANCGCSNICTDEHTGKKLFKLHWSYRDISNPILCLDCLSELGSRIEMIEDYEHNNEVK